MSIAIAISATACGSGTMLVISVKKASAIFSKPARLGWTPSVQMSVLGVRLACTSTNEMLWPASAILLDDAGQIGVVNFDFPVVSSMLIVGQHGRDGGHADMYVARHLAEDLADQVVELRCVVCRIIMFPANAIGACHQQDDVWRVGREPGIDSVGELIDAKPAVPFVLRVAEVAV